MLLFWNSFIVFVFYKFCIIWAAPFTVYSNSPNVKVFYGNYDIPGPFAERLFHSSFNYLRNTQRHLKDVQKETFEISEPKKSVKKLNTKIHKNRGRGYKETRVEQSPTKISSAKNHFYFKDTSAHDDIRALLSLAEEGLPHQNNFHPKKLPTDQVVYYETERNCDERIEDVLKEIVNQVQEKLKKNSQNHIPDIKITKEDSNDCESENSNTPSDSEGHSPSYDSTEPKYDDNPIAIENEEENNSVEPNPDYSVEKQSYGNARPIQEEPAVIFENNSTKYVEEESEIAKDLPAKVVCEEKPTGEDDANTYQSFDDYVKIRNEMNSPSSQYGPNPVDHDTMYKTIQTDKEAESTSSVTEVVSDLSKDKKPSQIYVNLSNAVSQTDAVDLAEKVMEIFDIPPEDFKALTEFIEKEKGYVSVSDRFSEYSQPEENDPAFVIEHPDQSQISTEEEIETKGTDNHSGVPSDLSETGQLQSYPGTVEENEPIVLMDDFREVPVSAAEQIEKEEILTMNSERPLDIANELEKTGSIQNYPGVIKETVIATQDSKEFPGSYMPPKKNEPIILTEDPLKVPESPAGLIEDEGIFTRISESPIQNYSDKNLIPVEALHGEDISSAVETETQNDLPLTLENTIDTAVVQTEQQESDIPQDARKAESISVVSNNSEAPLMDPNDIPNDHTMDSNKVAVLHSDNPEQMYGAAVPTQVSETEDENLNTDMESSPYPGTVPNISKNYLLETSVPDLPKQENPTDPLTIPSESVSEPASQPTVDENMLDDQTSQNTEVIYEPIYNITSDNSENKEILASDIDDNNVATKKYEAVSENTEATLSNSEDQLTEAERIALIEKMLLEELESQANTNRRKRSLTLKNNPLIYFQPYEEKLYHYAPHFSKYILEETPEISKQMAKHESFSTEKLTNPEVGADLKQHILRKQRSVRYYNEHTIPETRVLNYDPIIEYMNADLVRKQESEKGHFEVEVPDPRKERNAFGLCSCQAIENKKRTPTKPPEPDEYNSKVKNIIENPPAFLELTKENVGK